MTDNSNHNLGKILKRRRVMLSLTLRELADISGVSQSHLGRIERSERFPSASILRRIAKPLGVDEKDLLSLAGYLSPPSPGIAEAPPAYIGGQLDPYVSMVLEQEPVEVQRAVIGILSILKSLAKVAELTSITNTIEPR